MMATDWFLECGVSDWVWDWTSLPRGGSALNPAFKAPGNFCWFFVNVIEKSGTKSTFFQNLQHVECNENVGLPPSLIFLELKGKYSS